MIGAPLRIASVAPPADHEPAPAERAQHAGRGAGVPEQLQSHAAALPGQAPLDQWVLHRPHYHGRGDVYQR